MSITNYPDADFTPDIPNSGANTGKQSYNPTGSFRFWAQKVLPTVYDDSLSYYEILTKVVNYLNAVIQNVDSLNDSVDNTNSAFDTLQGYVNNTKDTIISTYNELQDYVNTYFDSLDVQEEINTKLDDMASDGSLSNVVSPFIPSLVADWLSDNITPTSPAIDASLTVSGAGADAKVTGDKLTALKNALSTYKPITLARLSELDTLVPFYAEAGDTLIFSTNDGSRFTVSQVRLFDSSGVQKTYWGVLNSSSPATKIVPSDKPNTYFVGISGETSQNITVINQTKRNAEYSNSLEKEKIDELNTALAHEVKKTNDELFADGNIPKVGSTINGYGIGADGIRYSDSNKQIVRYDISGVKRLHITLKTADDTYVFQSDTTLPSTSTPSSNIVGTPYKGIFDNVVEIPNGAVCVFITQAKSLPDDVVYIVSNIDALFGYASYSPYYFTNFELGNLNISNSGWSTSSYHQDTRIRINPNNPLKLLKGDIIKFTQNNIHFSAGYRVDGVYSDATRWTTGEYVCPVDGEYVFYACYINETTLESVNEIAQYCRICRINSPTYQDIKALQDNNSYKLPSYYTKSWINNMIDSIRDKSKILNGICFAFVTDLHFSANSLNSKYLLKAVLDNTSVPFVVAGGDFAPAKGTEDVLHETYDNIMSYVESIGQNNWFAMVGNHDFYVTDESVSPAITYYATWGEAYNYIFRKSERNMLNANVNYGCYVIKNDAQKTKIIILNSCEVEPVASDTLTYGAGRVTTAQINWFCEELLKDSGYKIIVMSHIPSDSAITQGYSSSQDEIQNVLVAFNGKTTYGSINFADTTNELICHITGHTHNDQSHIDRGVLSITTTCDAHYTDDGHGAVEGTVTEQAFDVFCFDYDTDTINAVRVGRGASRTWEKENDVWTQTE